MLQIRNINSYCWYLPNQLYSKKNFVSYNIESSSYKYNNDFGAFACEHNVLTSNNVVGILQKQ